MRPRHRLAALHSVPTGHHLYVSRDLSDVCYSSPRHRCRAVGSVGSVGRVCEAVIWAVAVYLAEKRGRCYSVHYDVAARDCLLIEYR